jgi:hypothetical protein
MQSLQINTGEIRLAINDDPERVIAFNPSDVMFAERFYKLMGGFEDALKNYQSRIADLEKETAEDDNGVPVNVADRIELMKEISQFMRKEIDSLFGENTSQKAFGDALNLDAFTQFFEGVTPYIQKARTDRVAKYTNSKKRK